VAEILTAPEVEDQFARIRSLDDVQDFELLGISARSRADYEPLISVVNQGTESQACAALCGLFYGAGAIGVGSWIGERIVGEPSSAQATIGAPILGLCVVRCADVTAFRPLMGASAPSWEGDILRAQRLVRDSFPDPEEYAALERGDLFEGGRFILEQLRATRHVNASEDQLLWYLKAFAGRHDVDEIFLRYLDTAYGEIAITALVGFGGHVVPISDLRRVPLSTESAFVRVGNMAAQLYRTTQDVSYLDFLGELSRRASSDRFSRLIAWARSI